VNIYHVFNVREFSRKWKTVDQIAKVAGKEIPCTICAEKKKQFLVGNIFNIFTEILLDFYNFILLNKTCMG
jgi:hypothetical protein